MHVPARAIDHAAPIAITRDVAAQGPEIEHLEIGIPICPPERPLGLKSAHLRGRQRREDRALAQVAIDLVSRDPPPDQRTPLLDEGRDEVRRPGPEAPANRL